MKKEWKKELARDMIALGSIPFFIIVLIRVAILHNPLYLAQFVIAGALFLILAFIFKSDTYSGLALIVMVFTVFYYNEMLYGIFARIFFILVIVALIYLDKDMINKSAGRMKLMKGILFGIISAGVSYYVSNLIFA